MPNILCTSGAFTKKIAVELPPISGLQFASFFGNGSLSPTDNQNLVAGGTVFTNIGAGPINHSNYSSIAVATNSLDLGMTDGYPAWTHIVAAAPAALGPTMLLSFAQNPDPGMSFFNGALGLIPCIPTFGAGTFQFTGRPVFPAVHLYAIVSVVGKPVTFYDLTTNEQASSSTNVSVDTPTRPSLLHWQLGATVAPTGFDAIQVNAAFALGAKSELLLSDLNTIAASLRYPLAARGWQV